MATPITPEQRKRMEENRRIAMEKRAAKMAQSGVSTLNPNASCFVPRALDLAHPQPSVISNGHSKVSSTGGTTATYPPKKGVCGSGMPSKSYQNTKKDAPSSSWNVITAPLSGTLSLIENDRVICYIGFNQKLNDIFKSTPGSVFDPNKKKWTFPLDQYEEFKKKVDPLAPNITVGSLPKSVLKMFTEKNKSSNNIKEIDISKIEPALLETLFPFQKEGVQ